MKTHFQNNYLREGSVIIITGASSGLGKELALALCSRSFRILITGRNKERLQQTVDLCNNNGKSDIKAFLGDLSEEEKCKQLIAYVNQHYNRIDFLFLNAGINAHANFDQIQDLNVFRKLMDTNFYSNVSIMKYALPILRKYESHVVVIGSLSGKFGLPERSAYCASKFALTGFFESIRTEEEKISITMIYPTSLDTPMRNNDILGQKVVSSGSKNKRESAAECAKLILNSLEKRHKDVYIPSKSLIGIILQPLFPNFMRKKVIQASKL